MQKLRQTLKLGDSVHPGYAAAIAMVVCVVFIGTAALGTHLYIIRCRQDAVAAWAGISRPMQQFATRLRHIQENESLRVLTHDLKPFGIESFYKAPPGEEEKAKGNIPAAISDFVEKATAAAADRSELETEARSYVAQHRHDLDRLYDGVLNREAPVWTFVPDDGMKLRPPSFLVARNISRVICADALLQIDRGDAQGAARAVEAGLKATANFEEQPIIFSQMIRVAIEALYAPVIARLPDDSEALGNLAIEVKRKREKWRDALQLETLSVQQLIAGMGSSPEDLEKKIRNAPTRARVELTLLHALLEIDCDRFTRRMAEQVRISRDAGISDPDLGIREMNDKAVAYAPRFSAIPRLTAISTAFRLETTRAWIRLNAMLLLREQAEIIRSSRREARNNASARRSEYPSVVIPRAKWRTTQGDGSESVSLKLTPAPAWTAVGDVIPSNFFLRPLDGSKAWTFDHPNAGDRLLRYPEAASHNGHQGLPRFLLPTP